MQDPNHHQSPVNVDPNAPDYKNGISEGRLDPQRELSIEDLVMPTSGAPVRATARVEVRPVLIVGVGGTGCLAVQHIKQRIRHLLGGRDAPFIRFVAFDTTIADDGVVRFDEGEFVNIGQLDFASIVQNIKNYPHLESWFPKDRLKPMQVGLGAMGIRHIGRLCYFQWRESPEVRDRLLKRLKELKNPALKDQVQDLGGNVTYQVDQGAGVDVHVIGSGAGGTGSGLFLDMAYDLRILAKEIAGSARVIGHLLLPDVFEGVIPDPVLPQSENNSHALLSEIDHFMDNGGWSVRYKGETVRSDEPPFDLIYLLGRNGFDGAVRTRDEAISMIGSVVGDLTCTAVGKQIMDAAVNLIPPILSRTDDFGGKPCPYASYGMSIGTVSVLEAKRLGRANVARRILDGLIGGTQGTEDKFEREARTYLEESRVHPTEIERSLQDVPAFSPQGAAAAEAEMFRKGQHARLIRELGQELLHSLEEKAGGRLRSAFGETLYAKARRMFTLPMQGAGGETRAMRVHELEAFLRGLVQLLQEGARICEQRIEALAEDSRSASRSIQELAGKVPAPANWRQSYLTLVEREDRKVAYTPFYARLREMYLDERGRLLERIDALETTRETLRSLRRPMSPAGETPLQLGSPYFRLLSADQILERVIDDESAVAARFREKIVELWAQESEAELSGDALAGELDNVAAKAVDRLLDAHRSDDRINVHGLLDGVNPSHLRDRVKFLWGLAQPGFRTSERYPKEKIVHIGYASGDPRGNFASSLRNIDGTMQVVPDLQPDVSMIRFVYGAPLWAIQGVRRWEQSAIDVQISERATHNLLSGEWAAKIGPLVPLDPEEREDLWLFTMFCCSGKIKKQGFTYHMYSTRLDGIRDRASMFDEFQRLLREDRLPRQRANREVEDFLVAGRDDLGVLDLLRDWHLKLQHRLDRESLGGQVKDDLKLLREEVEVLKQFIARKENDIDNDAPEASPDTVDSSAHEQDLWLFTVLGCFDRIRFEDQVWIDDHELGDDPGQEGVFQGFLQLIAEGTLSRDRLNRSVQDLLISGEDANACLQRLDRYAGTLKKRKTGSKRRDAALIDEQIAALRRYLQDRTGAPTMSPDSSSK